MDNETLNTENITEEETEQVEVSETAEEVAETAEEDVETVEEETEAEVTEGKYSSKKKMKEEDEEDDDDDDDDEDEDEDEDSMDESVNLETVLEDLPSTKSGMVQSINNLLSQMRKSELEFKINHIMEVLLASEKEIVERENGLDLSALDLSENVEDLFEAEDLSDDFKKKATLVFETAVDKRVDEVQQNIEENFRQDLEEQVAAYKERLAEATDKLLNVSIQDWQEDNKLAIHTGLKSEITEHFIEGMKTLFKEHYIDIPEDKEKVYEVSQKKLEEASAKLNDEIQTNLDLRGTIEGLTSQVLFLENTQDLTDSERERVKTLCEKVKFETEEQYVEHINLVKECYLNNDQEETEVETNTSLDEETEEFVTEDVILESVEGDVQVASEVEVPSKTKIDKYADFLSRKCKY